METKPLKSKRYSFAKIKLRKVHRKLGEFIGYVVIEMGIV